jgi:hypothetical protein
MSDVKNLAYGDPPYPGQAKRHYQNDPSGIEAAEVDHKELVERLLRDYDGWALSTNEPGLEHIKDLFPKGFFKQNGIRVAAWIKPWCSWKPSNRVQYTWEPVLFKGVRMKGSRSTASVRDYVIANITMKKGTHGAKPDAFNDWILDLIGYQGGDIFTDLFPGTGGMTEAVKRWVPKQPNKKKKVET